MVHHAVGVFEVLEFFEDDGYFSHCVRCLMFEFLIAMCVISAVLQFVDDARELVQYTFTLANNAFGFIMIGLCFMVLRVVYVCHLRFGLSLENEKIQNLPA